MTTTEIVELATLEGVHLVLQGDQIQYMGKRETIARLLPQLAAHKADILALLREREGRSASDAVLAAERLLRDDEVRHCAEEQSRLDPSDWEID